MQAPLTAGRFWKMSRLLIPAVVTLGIALPGHADIIGGVNFGSAGPSNWGILELGGSGAAGFGTTGATVSINGPNAGVYGTATQANIGIADGGKANFAGTTTIQGMLDESPTHGGNSISGTTIVGGQNLNYNFSTVASDAAAGLAAADALICNLGPICGTALNPASSETINPTNPGGQNVLTVSSINLGAGVTVSLGDGGNASTTWVILDAGGFSTSGGGFPITQGINVGSLLNDFSDLIVVNGNVNVSGGGNNFGGGSTVINGVLVIPTGTGQFTPGRVNGEVIAGGNLGFASGAQVSVPTPPNGGGGGGNVVPEPTSIILLGSVLGIVLGVTRKKKTVLS